MSIIASSTASIKLHVRLTAAERVSLANAVGNQHLTVVDSLIRKQLIEAISGGFDIVVFETSGIWSLTRIIESLVKHVDRAMANTNSVTIFEGLGVVKARLYGILNSPDQTFAERATE